MVGRVQRDIFLGSPLPGWLGGYEGNTFRSAIRSPASVISGRPRKFMNGAMYSRRRPGVLQRQPRKRRLRQIGGEAVRPEGYGPCEGQLGVVSDVDALFLVEQKADIASSLMQCGPRI